MNTVPQWSILAIEKVAFCVNGRATKTSRPIRDLQDVCHLPDGDMRIGDYHIEDFL